MRASDSWSRTQAGQNVMVRTANLQVMSNFGNAAPPADKARKKPVKDNQFVVGETTVGGEERI